MTLNIDCWQKRAKCFHKLFKICKFGNFHYIPLKYHTIDFALIKIL